MTLKQFGVDTRWMGLISFRANQWQALWAIGRSDTRTAFSLYSVVLIVLPSTMGNRVQWPVSETCCPASTSWASGVNSALPKALTPWAVSLGRRLSHISRRPSSLSQPPEPARWFYLDANPFSREFGFVCFTPCPNHHFFFFFPESSKQQRRVTPLSAQRYTICSLSLCLSSPARQALRSWLILDTSNACSRISVYSAIPAVLKKHSPSSVCWSVKYLFPRISQFAVWFKLLLTTMMLKKKDFTKYRRFDNIFSYLQVRSLKWDVNAWPSSASECSHVVVFYQCHNVGSFISFHSPTDGNGIPPGSRECKAKGSDNYNRWVDVFLQYKIKMQR